MGQSELKAKSTKPSAEHDADHHHELIQHWKSLKKKPTIIVFDLDYTLWPYFADCHIEPPISKRRENGKEILVDSTGRDIRGFSDVSKILKTLRDHCLDESQHIAIASRSTTPKLAMEIIEHLGWKNHISSFQIYPTNKKNHMNKIREELKFEKFEEVLFFDDDMSNIKSTSSIGVVAITVDNRRGVDLNTILHGLTIYNTKHHK
jgi:magnesium-dependent phosphatase 1